MMDSTVLKIYKKIVSIDMAIRQTSTTNGYLQWWSFWFDKYCSNSSIWKTDLDMILKDRLPIINAKLNLNYISDIIKKAIRYITK